LSARLAIGKWQRNPDGSKVRDVRFGTVAAKERQDLAGHQILLDDKVSRHFAYSYEALNWLRASIEDSRKGDTSP
jgi:hypothetical protein